MLIGCLAVVICCLCFGLLEPLELLAQDALYQHPDGASPDIFVIGIDEETLSALGPFDTWSRSGMAELIAKLTENPALAPRVIGVDVGFYGEKDSAADAALVASCEGAGQVVLGASVAMGTALERTAEGYRLAVKPVLLEAPFDALRAVTTYGHTNTDLDADGVVRAGIGPLTVDGAPVESFAQAVCRAYTGEAMPTPSDRFLIPYSAKPYAYYGTPGAGASFSKVLSGEYPADAFADAIVLIGAYAQGMADSFDTPVSGSARMYGVEIHANIVQALLEGKHLRALPSAVAWSAIALIWLAALFALLRLKLRYSLCALLGLCALHVCGSYALSYAGWMTPFVAPPMGLVLMGVVRFGDEYVRVWRDKRRLVADFSRYLPRQVAQSVAEHGAKALSLGGKRQEIAVLFVDIRGFTSLSDRLHPQTLVSLLNRFLDLTTRCIFSTGGTVDKFIGDATMALFGAPQPLSDYVYRAVCAALAMTQQMAALNAQLTSEGLEAIGFGVGVHCGEAVIGNMGTEHRMDYTAIGNTVNIAARLEGQASPGEVLISQAVYEQIQSRIPCEYVGERMLKGLSEAFPVWRAMAITEEGKV
jgi:adenylate cyclase